MPQCPGCEKTVKYLIKSKDEDGLSFGYCLPCLQRIECRRSQVTNRKGVKCEEVPQKASQTADLPGFGYQGA